MARRYLGDLTDAAALPRLTEQLNIRCCVTALAELPPSLKASVAESGVEHTWCNVRDVEEADIKEHFAVAYEKIEACRAAGTAAFVHCSRGVSRSASLCIAYLMRKEGWGVERAHEHVRTRRPIVLPNAGFLRCLGEFEKERSGERSGVYVPAKTKAIDELEFELPPPWAAEPTLGQRAKLVVQKAGEVVDELEVGEHQMCAPRPRPRSGRRLYLPCTFPVPSLYLPCTFPVPSLYLLTGGRGGGGRRRRRSILTKEEEEEGQDEAGPGRRLGRWPISRAGASAPKGRGGSLLLRSGRRSEAVPSAPQAD